MDAVPASLSVALPARAEKAGTGNPTLTTGDAPDSICPYGWRLAGYDGSGSYYDLNQKYANRSGNHNSDSYIQMYPLSFLRSGNYRYPRSTLESLTSFGGYWSSRNYSQTNAYYLSFTASYLYPQLSNDRAYGFPLRCLAR